jgi:mRNA interferase HigB
MRRGGAVNVPNTVKCRIAGGDYRLIVAFRFDLQIAWIKFLGTHGEYDKIDALTVSSF